MADDQRFIWSAISEQIKTWAEQVVKSAEINADEHHKIREALNNTRTAIARIETRIDSLECDKCKIRIKALEEYKIQCEMTLKDLDKTDARVRTLEDQQNVRFGRKEMIASVVGSAITIILFLISLYYDLI